MNFLLVLSIIAHRASAPPKATGRHPPDHTTAGPCAKPATAPFSRSTEQDRAAPSLSKHLSQLFKKNSFSKFPFFYFHRK